MMSAEAFGELFYMKHDRIAVAFTLGEAQHNVKVSMIER